MLFVVSEPGPKAADQVLYAWKLCTSHSSLRPCQWQSQLIAIQSQVRSFQCYFHLQISSRLVSHLIKTYKTWKGQLQANYSNIIKQATTISYCQTGNQFIYVSKMVILCETFKLKMAPIKLVSKLLPSWPKHDLSGRLCSAVQQSVSVVTMVVTQSSSTGTSPAARGGTWM